MPAYALTVAEVVQNIAARVERDGAGAATSVAIIREGAGYDTLGGTYRLTSRNWHNRQNPTRTYTNLAATLVAYNSLSAGFKQVWHVDGAGHRHLIVKG